ncbi:MAG: OsmC family protein [Candidatus Eisenbacteria bacterium]|nr:OsmC family protein [Candidatus Eisenbacteria bacterium]
MAEIRRTAQAVWTGDLKGGKGEMTATSGAFQHTPYSFATRFESAPGTNPEELIAAAHAACFSMAFSATLGRKGHTPERIETKATCIMTPQPTGGFKITRMELQTRGKVPGLSANEFVEIAKEAEQGCPVSVLLRPGAEIHLDAQMM